MGNCAGKLKKEKVPQEKRTTAPAPTPAPAAASKPVQQQQQQAPTSHGNTVAPGNAPKTTVPTNTTSTTSTTTTTSQPSSSGSTTKTVKVDRELHKYIIGTKGATIKDIKDQSGANVTIPETGDDVSVSGTNDECNRAIAMIEKIKSEHKTQAQKDKEYSEMRDGHEQESQRTDAMYKKYQAEVDALGAQRQQLNDQADAAFAAGDKSKGHELRERSKQLTGQMEEANKKASREIFADKNKNLDKFTVDLHGLKTKDALELLDERMAQLNADKSNSGKTFTIITGAGQHSGQDGPKIKPLIHKTFNERNIKFTEVNNGSIECIL